MSTTTKHENGFSVTTRYDACAQALFDAWTRAEQIEGWLATRAEVNARPGGQYVFRWPGPDGEFSARGEYLELETGRKIVQSWESWGPDGRFEDGDVTLTIEFRDLGADSAEMTQTERSPAYEDDARVEASIEGTKAAHQALATFLSTR